MRSLLLVASLSFATCQRVDEPAPLPASDPTPTPTSAPTAAPTSAAETTEVDAAPPAIAAPTATAASETPDAGRCIHALAEPPPPVAKPAAQCPKDPTPSFPALRHGKIGIPEAPGAPTIDVEIADTPASEQRGLMYRTKLGAERGMIFVWTREGPRTFWMRNTCLPLDMLFLAKDGTVVGLLEQVPTLNEDPRSVRCPSAYVLEMNAGWSRRHGVKPGMKLDLRL